MTPFKAGETYRTRGDRPACIDLSQHHVGEGLEP